MHDEAMDRIEARADSLIEGHAKLMRDLVGLRVKHDLTQQVVAERMSVSQSAVSQFERPGSNPTLSTIRRYALAVGARIEQFAVDDCAEHSEFRGHGRLRVIKGGRWEQHDSTPSQTQWEIPDTRRFADVAR